jgi:hypothetical protein
MNEPIWDLWRCSNCGDMNELASPAWRWNGEAWEHKCGDPQAGHFPARNFGPRLRDGSTLPPLPTLQPLPTPYEQVLESAVDWWLTEGHKPFYGAPAWVFRGRELFGFKEVGSQ